MVFLMRFRIRVDVEFDEMSAHGEASSDLNEMR
jgi:hypothetical protein